MVLLTFKLDIKGDKKKFKKIFIRDKLFSRSTKLTKNKNSTKDQAD